MLTWDVLVTGSIVVFSAVVLVRKIFNVKKTCYMNKKNSCSGCDLSKNNCCSKLMTELKPIDKSSSNKKIILQQ